MEQACYTIAMSKLSRTARIILLAMFAGYTGLGSATSLPPASLDTTSGSVTSPLAPDYVIDPNGSVTLRICFNWSCASRQTVTFSADDIALVKKRMAICSGSSIYERLQRIRIGIWQMERLAQKYQPLLANDLSINDFEADVEGRTDCVDNSSNTTTYLHILNDIGELSGWMVSTPKMRLPLMITALHWTAVIIDTESGLPWSVDSWYRPNGHLPMVMPLQDWIDEKMGWESPFEQINATPHSAYDLCDAQRPNPL